MLEESIGLMKIYNFWFLTEHVFGCLEYDLTVFRKRLSVGLSECMPPKLCGHCISRTNNRKLMNFYIQLHLDIIWC